MNTVTSWWFTAICLLAAVGAATVLHNGGNHSWLYTVVILVGLNLAAAGMAYRKSKKATASQVARAPNVLFWQERAPYRRVRKYTFHRLYPAQRPTPEDWVLWSYPPARHGTESSADEPDVEPRSLLLHLTTSERPTYKGRSLRKTWETQDPSVPATGEAQVKAVLERGTATAEDLFGR